MEDQRKMAVHYASTQTVVETPQWLFDRLNADYEFTLDVCALPENTKCPRYFTPEQDGLIQSWAGERCWMNPPYGREIGKWLTKARLEASQPETLVVALIPARTDTRWWHNDVMQARSIWFIRGRLRFVGQRYSAPFPSCIVLFQGIFGGGSHMCHESPHIFTFV